MKLKRINKKGFTLIEIIVVVVILAVLMAVAVPSVLNYITEADDAKYMTQARGAFNYAQIAITKAATDSDGLTSIELQSVITGASTVSGKPKIQAVFFYNHDGNPINTINGDKMDGIGFLENIGHYEVVFVKAGTDSERDEKYIKVYPNEKMEMLKSSSKD